MRRLQSFDHIVPSTLRDASEVMAERGKEAMLLAGGTDLLVRMKRGDIKPLVLVNLKRIEGLDQIEEKQGKRITIGALASLSSIEHSLLVRTRYPLLVQTLGVLGSPSIRNLATLGGNVGRASPAADSVPALIVLQATATVAGLNGEREVEIEKIFAGPGITILLPDEIIAAIHLPEPVPQSGGVYLKLGQRAGAECALVGVAAYVTLSDRRDRLESARVAMSAVAPIPLRVKGVEDILLSGQLTEERVREATHLAAETACPLTDMRATGQYRKDMVAILVRKAIWCAYNIARESEVEN